MAVFRERYVLELEVVVEVPDEQYEETFETMPDVAQAWDDGLGSVDMEAEVLHQLGVITGWIPDDVMVTKVKHLMSVATG